MAAEKCEQETYAMQQTASFCSRLNCRRVLATTSKRALVLSPDTVPSYGLNPKVGISRSHDTAIAKAALAGGIL